MSQQVTCSVVLPTFNRAPLIGEAIESVLAQSRADWELLVVDDGSTDETPGVLARYADRRIRYVREMHRGRSAARNRGVELAASDLVGFLDSDDRLLPTALDAHVQAHSAEADLGMTVGGYVKIDTTGCVIDVRRPWKEGEELTTAGWLLNCRSIPSGVMVRRSWLVRVGGFRTAMDLSEDWDLFLRLAVAGCRMTWVRESVCQYRQHAGNSIRALDAQLSAGLSVLAAIADDPRLPADTRAMVPLAMAWARMASARNAAAVGEDAHVRRALSTARAQARTLVPHGASSRASDEFVLLLEPLVNDLATRSANARDLSLTAKRWGLSSRELRHALARVEMRGFFSSVERGDRTGAARHLRRGLRRDPSWLTNRGVVGFLLGRRPRRQ